MAKRRRPQPRAGLPADAPAPEAVDSLPVTSPLDKAAWPGRPWVREMRLRSAVFHQYEAGLMDLGLTGEALDDALNRFMISDILGAAARRYAPELKRLQRFDRPGPGRPKGQRAALMRLLHEGVKSRSLSLTPSMSFKEAQEPIREYLQSWVDGGVVVKLDGPRRHPKTQRSDIRVTWTRRRGQSSQAWVSDLAKRLLRHLRSPS